MKPLKLSKSEEFARKHCIITMPKIRLYVGWKLYDKEGNIVSQWKDEAHSFVRNFKNFERSVFFAVNVDDGTTWDEGFLNFKNTSDAVISMSYPIGHTANDDAAGYIGPDNNDYYGIVVGTGITEVSQDDCALATKIVHGNSTGQLHYTTHTATNTYYTDTKIWEMTYSRSFTNLSGGNITVNEQGMIFYNGPVNTAYIMVARDLITPVTINNDANADFEYDMQMTFPA